MAVAGPTGATDGRPDEVQIAEIVDRLHRRYPGEQISLVDLESRVRSCFHEFGAARIRTFVGIFVERLVRRSIEYPATAIDAVDSVVRR